MPETAAWRVMISLAERSDSVVLLGAQPDYPEVEYGWIELGSPLGREGSQLFRVREFREKPVIEVARRLFEQGSLWNTFVMVGRVDAFLKIIESAAPDWYDALSEVTSLSSGDSKQEVRAAARWYADLAPADFSNRAVSANIERFAVLRLGDTGWSDLGDPDRLLALAPTLERKPPVRQYLPAHLELARAAATD